MSVEFEMEVERVAFGLDAYTDECVVVMADGDDNKGAGATFTGDQMRQLRRFLEWCYPASEDPPHEPDPWVH